MRRNLNVEMKDSGVEWIGEIPKHWSLKKITHVTDMIGSGTTPKSDNDDYYNDGNINWLVTGDLNDGYIFQTSNKVTQKALDELSSLKIYPENSLAIAMYGATIGKLGVLKTETTVNQATCVLKFDDSNSVDFWFYVFVGNRNYLVSLGYGGGQPNISQDVIKGLRFPSPPTLEEQILISRYLDKKTNQIDSLVEKIQKKIELLKEQRTLLINQYVTKGLDPNVELKESGVEWIGSIPKHWSIVRLRFLCDIKTGGKDTQDNVENGAYPFFVRSPHVERINSYSFDGEAVLTSGDGAGVGKIFHYYVGKFDYHQRVYKFSDFRGISGKYFYWFLKENFHYEILRWNAKSTVDSVRLPFLQNFPMVLPPIKEQKDILLEMDSIDDRVEKLIQVLIKKIETLKEYRQSLISSVVSGESRVTEDMI